MDTTKRPRNYVTKYMKKFCSSRTFRDRTKYFRKQKHKNQGY